MRITLSVTVIAAMLGAVVVVGAAQAQSSARGPFSVFFGKSMSLSWERSLQRYYDRERMLRQRGVNPLARLRTVALDRRRERLRQFYGDPARGLGLPDNARLRGPATGAPPPVAPVFTPIVALLDGDGDGVVSRQEYFDGRTRAVPAGSRGFARAQRLNRRLVAQFRSLDANRDGRVTPNETSPYPNARF
ncbi:MAG: hypothetical protein V3R85_00310 [Alphaproteobacteria bacterium]